MVVTDTRILAFCHRCYFNFYTVDTEGKGESLPLPVFGSVAGAIHVSQIGERQE